MSKPQTTPGPWDLATSVDIDIRNPSGIVVGAVEPQTGNRTIVGRVWGEGPVTNANARLIAAAPDLLAALKEARNFSWAVGSHTDDVCLTVLAECDAAIAKAEGRE